jgi:hypothetical protein
MAKYSAPPGYRVDAGVALIKFDYNGEYETSDDAHIAVLDALCPTWITRLDSESETKPARKRTAITT